MRCTVSVSFVRAYHFGLFCSTCELYAKGARRSYGRMRCADNVCLIRPDLILFRLLHVRAVCKWDDTEMRNLMLCTKPVLSALISFLTYYSTCELYR